MIKAPKKSVIKGTRLSIKQAIHNTTVDITKGNENSS